MKTKYNRDAAMAVAGELVQALLPATTRLMLAGSLRRLKLQVGDIELVYVPRYTERRAGLFETENHNLTDEALETLLVKGILSKRRNVRGFESWGSSNKLAVHVPSGIPVDLFSATEANWFNYLVCRTGSADNNKAIAAAALARGWQWHPYGAGFTDGHGNQVEVKSEQDVFRLVGMPYLEPQER